MPYDYERNRQIDDQTAQYDAGGFLPFLAVLALIVAGLVIYQFVSNDGEHAKHHGEGRPACCDAACAGRDDRFGRRAAVSRTAILAIRMRKPRRRCRRGLFSS